MGLFGRIPPDASIREMEKPTDAAKVRKYEAAFDGIAAYLSRVNIDSSIGLPEIYGEIIDRLYEAFERRPQDRQTPRTRQGVDQI